MKDLNISDDFYIILVFYNLSRGVNPVYRYVTIKLILFSMIQQSYKFRVTT